MTHEDAIFMNRDIRELFSGYNIVVLGDSIQRSVYKDLVCLFDDPSSGYVMTHELKAKGEDSFRNDTLLFCTEKTNSTDYKEVREYRNMNAVIRFYFITRCWNEYIESVFEDDFTSSLRPDVIIMNSTLWDMHRYGEEGKFMYEHNMRMLFSAVQRLPSRPVLLWNSALPLAEVCKGGFLRKGFKTLPWHDIERANLIAKSMAYNFDFIYVDLRKSLFRSHFTQADDGIHWSNMAHRNITNSILTAICRHWDMDVPVLIPFQLVNPSYYNRPYMQPPHVPPPQIPPPQPFMTPPSNRFHPYGRQWLNRDRLMPRAHQRSHTDPFPLPGARGDQRHHTNNNYRARFNKMNKVKTAASSFKPDRRPLTESNNASSATKTSSDRPVDKKNGECNDQANSSQDDKDDLENYTDCERCCPKLETEISSTSIDAVSTATLTAATNLCNETSTNTQSSATETSSDSVSSSNNTTEIADESVSPTVELEADKSKALGLESNDILDSKPDVNNNKAIENNDEAKKRKRDDSDEDVNDTRRHKSSKLI